MQWWYELQKGDWSVLKAFPFLWAMLITWNLIAWAPAGPLRLRYLLGASFAPFGVVIAIFGLEFLIHGPAWGWWTIVFSFVALTLVHQIAIKSADPEKRRRDLGRN